MSIDSFDYSSTIAAIATAPGQGGIGIIRLSGPLAKKTAQILGCAALSPRRACFSRFIATDGRLIDEGIALYFPAPHSFTGEEVVELQAHGSPVVLRELLDQCVAQGVLLAEPGEFSQRAFLNGKLDLVQAEAIADLIAATDIQAARAARRSLDGVFSQHIQTIAADMLAIRVQVEALIDFVDEPIEPLEMAVLQRQLIHISQATQALLAAAEQGRKLRDGLHAVIVGPPNAGKSSLLNALAGSERAIVSAVAGTTRDLITETVRIQGMELTLVDSAGLRRGGDVIEQEGMRRARAELSRADLAIVVLDACAPTEGVAEVHAAIADVPHRLWLLNKTDLVAANSRVPAELAAYQPLAISIYNGLGLSQVRARLLKLAENHAPSGSFSARQRHVQALQASCEQLIAAQHTWDEAQLELVAEHLRLAHDALGEITGRILPDDLLGAVFSTFCIGK